MTYCDYIGTIVGDQLQLHSSRAHSPDCPVYEKIQKIRESK